MMLTVFGQHTGTEGRDSSMLIDLNGMQFHLNIQRKDDNHGFQAEIVDEAFNFEVQRDLVHDLDGVASFVYRYAGLRPKSEALSMIGRRLEELYRTDSVVGANESKNLDDRIASAG